MTASLIHLGEAREASRDDLAGLSASLAQWVGEPYRLSRVSYGDELTLHFGDLRPAVSPRLGDKLYGAYVLGLRGSSWVLKSGPEPVVIASGADWGAATSAGRPLGKEELEAGPFVAPLSRVLAATPFLVQPGLGFGLELRLSDGTRLVVLPAATGPDEPEDEGLPALADWELATPRGLLGVGPGPVWSFRAAGVKDPV